MTVKKWTLMLSLTNLFTMRIFEASVRKVTRKIIVDTFDIYCNFPWKNIKTCTFTKVLSISVCTFSTFMRHLVFDIRGRSFLKTWYKIIYSSEIFFQQSTRHSLFWSIHSWKTLKIVCNVYIKLVCHRAVNLFIFQLWMNNTLNHLVIPMMHLKSKTPNYWQPSTYIHTLTRARGNLKLVLLICCVDVSK